MEPPTLVSPPRFALVWRGLLFGLGYLVLVSVAGLLTVSAILLYLVLQGRDANEVMDLLVSQEAKFHLQLASAIPTLLLLGLWVWACRRFFDRRPLLSLGLGPPAHGWVRTLLAGFGAGAGPIVATVGLLVLLSGLSWRQAQAGLLTWLLIPGLLIAAFNEEMPLRGYLLGNFVEAGRPLTGVLITSLLFWLLHSLNPAAWSSPWVAVNLFGAGVMLAMAYLASGNLWFPTALHYFWNLAQGVLFELPVSGVTTDGILELDVTGKLAPWLSGGQFGLEASLLVTPWELALSGLFFVLWKRGQARHPPGEDAGRVGSGGTEGASRS